LFTHTQINEIIITINILMTIIIKKEYTYIHATPRKLSVYRTALIQEREMIT